jgi:hypothetical protein
MKETYGLAADELSALREFLSLQYLLSVDTAFTDQSILQMMAQLDTLSDSYTQFKNAKLRELVDLTYTLLKDVDTCYKQKFPALYTAYCYANFGFDPDIDVNQEGRCATAIRNSLVKQGKILYVDTAYPLQDPNSNILFNVSKTDTVAALNRARSGRAQGAAA